METLLECIFNVVLYTFVGYIYSIRPLTEWNKGNANLYLNYSKGEKTLIAIGLFLWFVSLVVQITTPLALFFSLVGLALGYMIAHASCGTRGYTLRIIDGINVVYREYKNFILSLFKRG